MNWQERARSAVAKLPMASLGPQISKEKRGIILPSPLDIYHVGFDEQGRPLHQNIYRVRPEKLDVRQAVLLWDVIHLPEYSGLPDFEDGDITFLEQCGLIRRYKGPDQDTLATTLGISTEAVVQAASGVIHEQLRMNLFSILEKKEPGQWAMGRGVRSPEIPMGERAMGRGVLVELTNMLPVPDGQVNIADVIAFKDKRKDELIDLRSHLSSVYDKVSRGDVDAMVKHNALLKFEKSIEDYRKVIGESGFTTTIADLVGNINVAGPATAAIAALAGPVGYIGASLLNLVNALTITPFSGLKRRNGNEAFEYVGRYHKELSWHQN